MTKRKTYVQGLTVVQLRNIARRNFRGKGEGKSEAVLRKQVLDTKRLTHKKLTEEANNTAEKRRKSPVKGKKASPKRKSPAKKRKSPTKKRASPKRKALTKEQRLLEMSSVQLRHLARKHGVCPRGKNPTHKHYASSLANKLTKKQIPAKRARKSPKK
uniref:Uncharacterized protein n=1 Tax=Pithovirus LCPAC304 TaxID=2506594 RepID=A0A481Z8N2_9VIRU|nr:MAG: hypothetical protein LCPAC304_06200 [Pithovirus LCPAC304]